MSKPYKARKIKNLKFSIVIITSKRAQKLVACLNSILNQKPCDEIVVVVNGEDSKTNYLLSNKYSEKVKIISLKSHVTPAHARNIAIKSSRFDYILFLDDDTILPENYINKSLKILDTYKPDVLGGPDTTKIDATYFEKAFGVALLSPFMTGPTRFRHKKLSLSKLEESDEFKLILCHMWFKRSLFSADKFSFDSEYGRNEENKLLAQLKEENKKIYYDPSLYVFHNRKQNFTKIHDAYSKSGYYRFKMCFEGHNKRWYYFASPLVLLLLLFFMGIFMPEGAIFVLVCLLFVSLVSAIYVTWLEKKKRYLFDVFLIQNFVLLSYALGSLKFLLEKIVYSAPSIKRVIYKRL